MIRHRHEWQANIVPSDQNGIAFSCGAAQVLNVFYLTPHARRRGGFFPQGVNGIINTSGSGQDKGGRRPR
ncbi:MAG TPA: hypothetical protein VHJ19_01815 [Gammaproteobacteria bacterium]|nr:hypothetical protein [Gammaproteobacteria bacterium]